MTTTHLTLKGRPLTFGDGSRGILLSEEDDDTATIVIDDDHGREAGRVRVRRLPKRSSAEIAIWTALPLRRRGVASAGLAAAMEWAQRRGLRYLVGEASFSDPAGRAFLARSGFVVALQSFSGAGRFALLVPSVARANISGGEAFDRAMAALEAGASVPEAQVLHDALAIVEAPRPAPAIAA